MSIRKLIAILWGVALAFSACDTSLSDNPYEDTTKLWPAFSNEDDSESVMGYINAKGKMVLPAKCQSAYYFSGGIAKIVTAADQLTHFIDAQGNRVYSVPADEWCENYCYNGCVRFRKGNMWGLYDRSFNVVIPADYWKLGDMTKDGLAYFESAQDQGYINRNGDTILYNNYATPRYGNAYFYTDFRDGLTLLRTFLTEKSGAVNTKGELVIDTAYYNLFLIGGGMLAFLDGGPYGLLNTDGELIREPAFHYIKFYADNGLLPVSFDGTKWGCVNQRGELVIPDKYDDMMPFYDGVAWAFNYYKDEEDGFTKMMPYLVDTKGEVLLTLKGKYPLSVFHNGLCLVRTDFDGTYTYYEYIDKKGNVIYRWPHTSGPKDIFLPNMVAMFAGTEYAALAKQLDITNKE